MFLYTLLFSFLQSSTPRLEGVSVGDFESFINATQYITDAERYGWSVVQQNFYEYEIVWGAFWCNPDGFNPPSSSKLPVTQVSYNDALAYCKWAQVRLPTYDEYWQFAKLDARLIQSENKGPIKPLEEVNIVGNVWDLTHLENKKDQVRLAGGSIYCSVKTCHGTVPDRELFVDSETANYHIGFSVVIE